MDYTLLFYPPTLYFEGSSIELYLPEITCSVPLSLIAVAFVNNCNYWTIAADNIIIILYYDIIKSVVIVYYCYAIFYIVIWFCVSRVKNVCVKCSYYYPMLLCVYTTYIYIYIYNMCVPGETRTVLHTRRWRLQRLPWRQCRRRRRAAVRRWTHAKRFNPVP